MQQQDLDDFLACWHDSSDTMRVHTSGSTGIPKYLKVSKTRMIASAQMTLSFLDIPHGVTSLLCLPMRYISGIMMAVRAEVGKLRTIVVEPNSHPLAQLDSAPYFVSMIPLQVRASLDNHHESSVLRGVKQLIIGGASIDADLEAVLSEFPNAVWATYGMTETLSHIAMRRISGSRKSEWYTPLPGVSVSVSDIGTLVVNAPHLSEEQLQTNDIVEMTPDGRFRVFGRVDNVINSGGVKLQIEQIEGKLYPYLPFSFVITSVPDARFGETVAIICENTNMTDAEITDICRQKLHPYSVPRTILRVKHIPMTPNDKPARMEIKRIAVELIQ